MELLEQTCSNIGNDSPSDTLSVLTSPIRKSSSTKRSLSFSTNPIKKSSRSLKSNPPSTYSSFIDSNLITSVSQSPSSSLFLRSSLAYLSSQSTLEDWSQWLDSLLNDLLKPHSNLSAEKYTKQAKQILLNWSYYCSMVIRDLTLRSAASFGSFHLIRLLYDEYLFYLIELI